jgi:tripartite-type tricarboxylate transporter receptor subunit TctC
MPMALRESIAADIQAVVTADPSIAQRLAATGQVVEVRGPAEFAAATDETRTKLADIAKALGIKAATHD